MRLKISRFIAIILLIIPGLLATYGFLEMKDAFYDYFATLADEKTISKFEWLKFIIGFVCFAIGVGFIGGWIFFRDRKRNYVAPRFMEKNRKKRK